MKNIFKAEKIDRAKKCSKKSENAFTRVQARFDCRTFSSVKIRKKVVNFNTIIDVTFVHARSFNTIYTQIQMLTYYYKCTTHTKTPVQTKRVVKPFFRHSMKTGNECERDERKVETFKMKNMKLNEMQC